MESSEEKEEHIPVAIPIMNAKLRLWRPNAPTTKSTCYSRTVVHRNQPAPPRTPRPEGHRKKSAFTKPNNLMTTREHSVPDIHAATSRISGQGRDYDGVGQCDIRPVLLPPTAAPAPTVYQDCDNIFPSGSDEAPMVVIATPADYRNPRAVSLRPPRASRPRADMQQSLSPSAGTRAGLIVTARDTLSTVHSQTPRGMPLTRLQRPATSGSSGTSSSGIPAAAAIPHAERAFLLPPSCLTRRPDTLDHSRSVPSAIVEIPLAVAERTSAVSARHLLP